MRASDFASATGAIRSLEKRILSAGSLERVVDAPNGSAAIQMLTQNSDYDFSALEREENFEPALRAKLVALYRDAYALSPDERIVDIPAARYDFHNLRVAIKARKLGVDASDLLLPLSRTTADDIATLISAPDKAENARHLAETAREAVACFEETGDPLALGMQLDRALFARQSALADGLGVELISQYVCHTIDLFNLKALLRAKNMQKGLRFLQEALADGGSVPHADFLEQYEKPLAAIGESFYYKYFGALLQSGIEAYEKSANFSALERAADNLLIEEVKQSKYIAFGPENIFAYIVAKENEIRQVRILLTCKFNGIDDEVIKERLRDNYA